jgi:hypothetical protein
LNLLVVFDHQDNNYVFQRDSPWRCVIAAKISTADRYLVPGELYKSELNDTRNRPRPIPDPSTVTGPGYDKRRNRG